MMNITKKKLASVSFLILSFAASAQSTTETSTKAVENGTYNKWSIELNGGVNKPIRAFSPGYSAQTLNLFHGDLGARYMFNTKFGLKLDFGYDKFQERDASPKFETTYLRTDLQGVVNLGRVLNFENFTNSVGLLAHGGFGVSKFKSKDGSDSDDYMVNAMLGLTAQIRLTNSLALTGDLTGIAHGLQDQSFDGTSPVRVGAFDGILLNASIGLTVYLGKNEKHADWAQEIDTKYNDLEQRVTTIETGLIDTDKDGVADLYDLEPNSITGVAVNTKGQTVDANKNGVPDELESYLERTYGQKETPPANSTVEDLINGGYVNTYFESNSAKPTNTSLAGVDFLVKYLKNNPSKKADVIGYADEVGNTDYNQALSQKRAESVKNILISAGIDASRLNVVANGEDTSVNKKSKEARQIVRRVTFKVY
ncbi:OmpA family protein [Flavobacterium sp. MC2016-06]|uniref:OmpA family protein n=1 Tax=Flavobacterium sp. MC2016-06 TaxID=2676308 RepID=UPI00209B042A|nr:OmpA family protein [Flavobacterium sp. MC2016-06]